MDADQFRQFGKAAVDYIADYVENVRQRHVLPSVRPGYLKHLIPDTAPEDPEPWQEVLKDVERVIMPGMTHWVSPQFHAFYPTANSYPAIVGDILSAGLGCMGLDWLTSPACTELEVEMMNWLGKLLDLPKEFLNCSDGPGGGVIQGSASESTLVGLFAARKRMVERLKQNNPNIDENVIRTKLVAYSSDQSNSSVEKAGTLGAVVMRLLPCDDKCSLRGPTLQKAIEDDIAKGLIPCYFVANLGTTGTCGFDRMDELGPICQKYGIWMHIDAAYAGAAFTCPEFRYRMNGIEFADSFDFNLHKWMLVNADCSAMWVKDAKYLINAFDPHDEDNSADEDISKIPDYTQWQIPIGRRFRSLKVWAVLRTYGADGIRNHVRKQVALAQEFTNMVLADSRFEIVTEVNMGLVCFRIRGENFLTEKLFNRLTERKNIFVTPCTYRGKSIIRFCVCSRLCELHDIEFAWNEIKSLTDDMFTALVDMCNNVIEKMDASNKFKSLDKLAFPIKLQEKSK